MNTVVGPKNNEGEYMSLFTKFQDAIQSEDATKYGALYHEDFQFIRHQTGTSMNKTEIVSMIEKMFLY